MEQLIIAGYIPFTNTQITFRAFAITVSVLVAAWYYWSLEKRLKYVKATLPPTISPDM